jgi:hypothetical protein
VPEEDVLEHPVQPVAIEESERKQNVFARRVLCIMEDISDGDPESVCKLELLQ